jgi:hypothetical protein
VAAASPAGRSGEVAVLPSAAAEVSASTVNRKLAAVSAFYAHQARNGAEVGDLLAAWRTCGRGGWKPFLFARADSVSPADPGRARAREDLEDTISQIPPNTGTAPIRRIGWELSSELLTWPCR